jgi:tetratricopeptide (TPR) repeat protein
LIYLREAANQRAEDDLRMLQQPVAIPQTSDAERVLTAAAEYMRLGLWQAALDVLSHNYPQVPEEQREPGVPEPKNHPMVAYYRAYCREKLGQSANADYTAAAALPVPYVFPNGAQSLHVLEHAVALHPNDAPAHYLLGNMRLQSGLVDDATNEWRTAQRLNRAIPVLNASLGRVLLRLKHDPEGALESFRAGLTPDPLNPELYAGFSTAAAIMARPAAERVAALERYPDSSHLPTALVYDLALAYAESGVFDKARHLFENRFFPREEGGTNVRQVWVRVRALEAASNAEHGKCADALATLDRLRQPVAGLSFTNDGLEPFIDAAPNQALFGKAESACGRPDAAAKRRSELSRHTDLASLVFAHTNDAGRLESAAARQNAGSSWQAAIGGLAELELGHTDKAAVLLRAALLLPDRNLAHHLARSALAGIKR